MAPIISEPLSRRGLLAVSGAAATAGAASLLSGCGGVAGPGTGLSKSSADLEVVRRLLALELGMVDAYGAIVRGLRGSERATARHFADQEMEHADTLTRAIKLRGGDPAVEPLAMAPDRVPGPGAALRLAAAVESAAIGAYRRAVPRIEAPDIRATCAEIAANEAQHLAVVSQARGLPGAPSAFVRGSRPQGE
ncbi:MAG: ferritin-like domain-containing protein [Solirubrobacterales bacterium]